MTYPETLANLTEEQFEMFKQGAADRYAALGFEPAEAQALFDAHIEDVGREFQNTRR